MPNRAVRFVLVCLFCLSGLSHARAEFSASGCKKTDGGLGVERILEIDTSSGPLYGAISLLEKEKSFLGPKEIVLTFDDGPFPSITRSILKTLDSYCTKATFFSVGRMALAYPSTIKEILRRGHTLGGHTWSHPLNLKRMKLEKAIEQIENGFAAISVASGDAVVPFFRFPGLSDSNKLLEHLQQRGIATFTVDVVSDDSFISNWREIVRKTLDRVEMQNGGIILFHDIKSATAKALPKILKSLKTRGYKVVHLRAKKTLEILPDARALMQKRFDKKHRQDTKNSTLSMPFATFTAHDRFTADLGPGPPVEVLEPRPKERGAPRPETMPLPIRKPELSKNIQ